MPTFANSRAFSMAMAACRAKRDIRARSWSVSGLRAKVASTPWSLPRTVSGHPAKETSPLARAQAWSAMRSSFATSFVASGSRVSAMHGRSCARRWGRARRSRSMRVEKARGSRAGAERRRRALPARRERERRRSPRPAPARVLSSTAPRSRVLVISSVIRSSEVSRSSGEVMRAAIRGRFPSTGRPHDGPWLPTIRRGLRRAGGAQTSADSRALAWHRVCAAMRWRSR